jgi:hypothetical protein
MMSEQKNRYPGAQPFSDDAFSHRMFFGRREDSLRLTDKIVANQTVVIYGRSGLGKTSLLNAGVAPLLREEGYLPLFVRVNNIDKDLLCSVLDAVPAEAARQGIEYVSGQTDSLWSFFKTAEFWCDDLLLTPVIIFDQFEELFTLQREDAREEFLDELSFLVRGVRPPSATSSVIDGGLSERPPAVRIVFSLREDYLGFLEEAADKIPQIFDSRFRLAPLSADAAQMAILGPAHVDDAVFSTLPFDLDDEAVSTILGFLSKRRSSSAASSRRYIEPFQLQLVCRRIEQIAVAKQQQSSSKITISIEEIGGAAGLAATLKDFYSEAILNLAAKRVRKASRRLCEDYLISAEGRRLSLEENEIRRQLGLSREELGKLVSSRLLRTENRAGSIYYELSHDALVEPILAAAQQKKAWLGIIFGSMLFLVFSMLTFLMIVQLLNYEYPSADSDPAALILEIIGFGLLLFAMTVLTVISIYILRNSTRSLFRHRRAREAKAEGLAQESPRKRWLLSGILLAGGVGVAGFGLMLLYVSLMWVSIPFSEDARLLAEAFDMAGETEQILLHGIGLDIIAFIIASVTVLLVGGSLVRQGIFKMIGYSGREAPEFSRLASSDFRSKFFGILKIFLGILFLFGALLWGFVLLLHLQCSYLTPGELNNWWLLDWFNLVQYYCLAGEISPVVDIAGDVLMIIVCIIVAIPMLQSGAARKPEL